MSRLNEIYEGWKNYIFPTPQIETLAKERIAVCVECEYLNALNVCTACHCPTAGKARSPESRCPYNKWPDGWGALPERNIQLPVIENTISEYYWDEEKQAYIGKAEWHYKQEMLQNGGLLYQIPQPL